MYLVKLLASVKTMTQTPWLRLPKAFSLDCALALALALAPSFPATLSLPFPKIASPDLRLSSDSSAACTDRSRFDHATTDPPSHDPRLTVPLPARVRGEGESRTAPLRFRRRTAAGRASERAARRGIRGAASSFRRCRGVVPCPRAGLLLLLPLRSSHLCSCLVGHASSAPRSAPALLAHTSGGQRVQAGPADSDEWVSDCRRSRATCCRLRGDVGCGGGGGCAGYRGRDYVRAATCRSRCSMPLGRCDAQASPGSGSGISVSVASKYGRAARSE